MIEEYSGITEEVVSQLDVSRGESCSGEAMCAAFKGSYFDEFSAHACDAFGMSENQKACATNSMVQTVQMARPIEPDWLWDEDTVRQQSHSAMRDAYCAAVRGDDYEHDATEDHCVMPVATAGARRSRSARAIKSCHSSAGAPQ